MLGIFTFISTEGIDGGSVVCRSIDFHIATPMMMFIPLWFFHMNAIQPPQSSQEPSWSVQQAIAIMAVDNLTLDQKSFDLLSAVDRGELTVEDVIAMTHQEIQQLIQK